MRIRHTGSGGPDKVEMQMTPMIDVVFQLLTFFLFNFKIAAIEGDFDIKMPLAAPGATKVEAGLPIGVRLAAAPDGSLAGIYMNNQPVETFDALRSKIIEIIGAERGPNSAAETSEVELEFDYDLKYSHVIRAITAVTGYVAADGHVVRLIQKVRFAPPKKR